MIKTIVRKLALRHPFLSADFIKNIGMLFQPHFPENTLAWVQSFDTNYMTHVNEWKSTNSYKKVSINCPVDVSVYDSEGNKVSYIKNDEVQEIEDGLTSYIDYDGQKVVCIPKDETYSIQMLATDNGKVNCSISNYNAVECKNERIDNFYDMSVKKGDNLVLNINENSNDNDDVYIIQNGNVEINPDESVSGDAATKKYNIRVNTDGNGKVSGENKKHLGEFAEVSAVADDGHSFIGWYENNILLSKDEAYRFVVKSDKNLIAKFEKSKDYINEKNKDDINVKISKKQYTYNGKSIKPNVTIYNGQQKIDKKLYEIKYRNNKNVGTATITVSFKGVLSNVSVKTVTFNIVPKNTKIRKVIAKRKGMKISWKKNKKQTTGYIIKYSTHKKMRKNVKTKIIKKYKKTSISINKLVSKKKYYVKISTYKKVKGKKYYSSWSKMKEVRIK